MKKFKYGLARGLTKITGVVFFTQILIEAMFTRKEGWEYTLHICGALFVASLLYSLCLVILNARSIKNGQN